MTKWIKLPELEIEDLPMTLIDGKPEFSSAGNEWFLWNCSLTISADPSDPSEWKIERIALVNEDRVPAKPFSQWVKRHLEITGEMFFKAVTYFNETHSATIEDHVITHLEGVLEDAEYLEKEFHRVA